MDKINYELDKIYYKKIPKNSFVLNNVSMDVETDVETCLHSFNDVESPIYLSGISKEIKKDCPMCNHKDGMIKKPIGITFVERPSGIFFVDVDTLPGEFKFSDKNGRLVLKEEKSPLFGWFCEHCKYMEHLKNDNN